MPRVFVSHATPDRPFVEGVLLPALEERGVGAWYCARDIPPGALWEPAIRKGLEGCDAVVLVLSPAAVESRWVHAEVAWAVANRSEQLIPVMLTACKPADLHAWLPNIQHVDATADPAAAAARVADVFAPPPAAGPVDRLVRLVREAARASPGPPIDAVRACYAWAAPRGYEPPAAGPSPAEAAAAYCAHLARAPLQPSGASPLLTFVRALLPHLPAKFAAPLGARVQETAAFVGERAPAPAAASAAPPAASYFVVGVRSAEVTAPGCYFVETWFDGGGGARPATDVTGPHPPDRLPAAVRAAYEAARTRLPVGRDTRVEFVLPRELLAAPVDQWEVEVDGLGDFPVGVEHHVTVRAADRYHCRPDLRRVYLHELTARGPRLAGCARAAVTPSLPVPDPAGGFVFRPGALADRARQLYLLVRCEPAVFGVVFDAPPAAGPPDEVAALLRAGVPVVAWARDAGAAKEAVDLLDDVPPQEVAGRLHKLRVSAARPAGGAGRHITLVWDDPRRPPPAPGDDDQLHAPGF